MAPRATYPAEGAKAVVKTHRPHDVFYIAGVAITTLRSISPNIRPRNTCLFKESIAIVPKVHAFSTKGVDDRHVPAKCRPHLFHEKGLIADKQFFGFLKAIALRTIAEVVNIVQRCLVTSQLNGYFFLQQRLPKVHNVALVYQGYRLFVGLGCRYSRQQQVEVCIYMRRLNVAVTNALGNRVGVNFCYNTYSSRNHSGQRLRTRHTTKPGSHKQLPA